MKIYTIHTAKTHLSQLIEQACAGEEVVITKGKNPVVKLVPVTAAAHKRQFGAMRGQATVTEAFFEPLPDEELAAWEIAIKVRIGKLPGAQAIAERFHECLISQGFTPLDITADHALRAGGFIRPSPRSFRSHADCTSTGIEHTTH